MATNNVLSYFFPLFYFPPLMFVLTNFSFQEIKRFQAKLKHEASQGSQGGQPFKAKKTLHFYTPSVELLAEEYYLIASDVFIISGSTRKLTRHEIDELPVIISWKGPRFCFHTDEKKCYELLTEIFQDMNMMQNPKFVSFPLGNF